MRVRVLMLLVVVVGLAGTGLNAQQASAGFDGPARMHNYVHALVGPTALLGVAAATALDQIRDDPPEWNIGDRALSSAGRLVAQETLHHGLAAVMDRSTWYYRCTCTDTGSRVAHAFAEAVTDHDRAGGTHFSVARVAGAYGGAYAETLWRPHRTGTGALAAGTSSIVGSAVLNLFHEFIR